MAVLDALLPAGTICVEALGDLEHDGLYPDEAALVARSSKSRRREFTTGRRCAHAALSKLGAAPAPVSADDRGAPQWPDGVVGAITHSGRYRAAAVAWETDVGALGIDAEPERPLSVDALRHVARDEERRQLSEMFGSQLPWDRLLFS